MSSTCWIRSSGYLRFSEKEKQIRGRNRAWELYWKSLDLNAKNLCNDAQMTAQSIKIYEYMDSDEIDQLFRNISMCFIRSGNCRDAEQGTEKIHSRNLRFVLLGEIARCFCEKGEFQMAKESIEKIPKSHTYKLFSALREQVQCLCDKGEFKKAAEMGAMSLSDVIELKKTNGEACTLLPLIPDLPIMSVGIGIGTVILLVKLIQKHLLLPLAGAHAPPLLPVGVPRA